MCNENNNGLLRIILSGALLPKMFTTIKLLCICAVVVSTIVAQNNNNNNVNRFKVIFEWNYINFTWPSADALQDAITSGKYIPEHNHISGVKQFEDYLYITVPRMKNGVPATLTRIPYNPKDSVNTAPLLEPYPSWEINVEGDCNSLQNVQNVEIDTKGYLYILDGGRTQTLVKSPSNICRPRLIIYDTKLNQTVTTYIFPQDMTSFGSFLYDLVVDDVDGGYLYISDNSGIDPAIIVYSIKEGTAWIIRDQNSMKAAPEATHFIVNGTAVSATINIAGIALGPRITVHGDHEIVSQDRMVYYCPLSSYRLYSISSAVLRDRSSTAGISSQVKDLGSKASQTDGMIMDQNGVLYYGLLADNSIARWDSKTSFPESQKVITRDKAYLQWPDSLAFDMSGNLLVVTNKLQKFIYGKLNLTEPNFRILQGNVGAKSYLYAAETSSTSTMNPSTMDNTLMNITNNPGNLYYNSSDGTSQVYTIQSSGATYKATGLLLFGIIFLLWN